jgi:serpin B
MHEETSYSSIGYYIDDSITVLQMPLKKTDAGAQLEFTAVMPSGDLGEHIKNVTLDELNSTLDNTISADATGAGVSISIPKFKFEYGLDFKNDLQSLGIQQAFTRGEADFSKMASQRLVVGQAIHKANIDFSEDGIKAAAVTAFSMANDMAPLQENEPIEITINRPFFFVIRDKNNGTIWFTGAVYQPNLWENDAPSYR